MGKKDAPKTNARSAPEGDRPEREGHREAHRASSARSGAAAAASRPCSARAASAATCKGAVGNMFGPVVGDSYGLGGLGIRGSGSGGGGSGRDHRHRRGRHQGPRRRPRQLRHRRRRPRQEGRPRRERRHRHGGGDGLRSTRSSSARSSRTTPRRSATATSSSSRSTRASRARSPSSGSSTATAPPSSPQVDGTATTLEDGKVHECMMSRITSWAVPEAEGRRDRGHHLPVDPPLLRAGAVEEIAREATPRSPLALARSPSSRSAQDAAARSSRRTRARPVPRRRARLLRRVRGGLPRLPRHADRRPRRSSRSRATSGGGSAGGSLVGATVGRGPRHAALARAVRPGRQPAGRRELRRVQPVRGGRSTCSVALLGVKDRNDWERFYLYVHGRGGFAQSYPEGLFGTTTSSSPAARAWSTSRGSATSPSGSPPTTSTRRRRRRAASRSTRPSATRSSPRAARPGKRTNSAPETAPNLFVGLGWIPEKDPRQAGLARREGTRARRSVRGGVAPPRNPRRDERAVVEEPRLERRSGGKFLVDAPRSRW